MSDEPNTQFLLGSIVARLNAQDARHDEMKTTLVGQDTKLDTILAHVERQKGGRTVLLAIGSGIAATCGTAASIFVTWLTAKPD